ncbi:MAG: class I SAM-dependent methyltransferase [bacterium]|nr:class I SAM-dependent methyltransferase [bacterium]
MKFYQLFAGFYEREIKEMCQECKDFIEKKSKILDLGCGSGIAAQTLKDIFSAEVVGTDVKDLRIKPIPFSLYDGKRLNFRDNEFDVVLLSYVLHHCPDPAEVLREAKRVCKKRVIVFEDVAQDFLSKTISFLHQITYNPFFLGKKQKLFLKNREEWKSFFEEQGFEVFFEKDRFDRFFWNFPQKRAMFVLEKTGA